MGRVANARIAQLTVWVTLAPNHAHVMAHVNVARDILAIIVNVSSAPLIA